MRNLDATKYFGFPENWRNLDAALRVGGRGFPGGSSLSHLLTGNYRYRRHTGTKPSLSLPIIRKAILACHAATGKWPRVKDGDASQWFEFPETWTSVDSALRVGMRSLAAGSSLYEVMAELGCERHQHKSRSPTALTLQEAEEAIRSFYVANGRWPNTRDEGMALKDVSWGSLGSRIRNRKIEGCTSTSLADLCAQLGLAKTKRRPRDLLTVSVDEVRAAAREYERKTGEWPTGRSVDYPPKLPKLPTVVTWAGVESLMRAGHRGLPEGGSLHKLRMGVYP